MEIVNNSWKNFFERETNKPYFKKLEEFVNKEYLEHTIYPKEEDIFNAFKYTPLDKVKVVIIAQDPYINENQAIGIAFATGDNKVAPSLRNIYKEITEDTGIDTSKYNCDHPIDWARAKAYLCLILLLLFAQVNQILIKGRDGASLLMPRFKRSIDKIEVLHIYFGVIMLRKLLLVFTIQKVLS